ncbi:hypothetical protein Patl1_31400 [Pistacia atlantica]|uniref:Uncharacterized protein n=1 Tax=Pistacia atlantica TaxID=434234 RepID=A0ACC1ANT8_9ROSI|nr:hypothetical protein Patl1_31400 [Pistacia atlantica]
MAGGSSSSIASMSPGNSSGYQKDEVLFSDDPNFALHGEIMMLIFVLLFVIFLFFLLVSLYLKKRSKGPHHTTHCSLEQVFPRNLPAVQFQDHLHQTGSKLQHQQQYENQHQYSV